MVPQIPSPRGDSDPVRADDREAGLAALEVAARVGPFFTLLVDPPGDGWTPLGAFAADSERVAAAVDDARVRIAEASGAGVETVEPRAAASVWHLGIAARVVSPALGMTTLARWAPRLDRVLWSTGPALAIRADDVEGTWISDAADAAAAIEADVVRPAIGPITESVAHVASVSTHVLWGNVWSAFAGAAAVLAAEHPDSGQMAVGIVAALVATAPRPLPGGYGPVERFRRETCCLYYRLPGGGLCGDCVLGRVPRRRRAPQPRQVPR